MRLMQLSAAYKVPPGDIIFPWIEVQSNLAIRMWGGPAKIKNISRYSYRKVCTVL